MNILSRTITGGAMILIGLVLIILSFFTMFVPLIYGIPVFVIGLIIFFNRGEDDIEQIKKEGKRRSKKK